jgi:threonine dehydrogenase-like Zn-dependent dehydrogenase
MNVLCCSPPGPLVWRTVDALRLTAPAQAIVRPLVVATCDIDAPLLAGRTPYRGPIALGHECIAEVVSVGPDVRQVRVGARVVVPFQASCGGCGACRRGHTGNCTSVAPMTMFGFGRAGGDLGGALADELLVPFADAMLVPFPASLDPTHWASLADNLPDAYRAVAEPLLAWPGAEVLIVGGQCVSIGLYSVDLALALGASSVIYLDVDEERCRRATALGADARSGPYPTKASRRYAVTVDASADPSGLACALRSTAPDGVCTSTGGYFEATTPFPLRDLYLSVGTFRTGRCHARPAIEPLLELAERRRLRPEHVTSRVVAFADAAAALAEGRAEKIVFVRPSSSAF